MRLLLPLLLLATTLYAAPNPEPYPQPASKKGLQVQMADDAVSLGIRHATLNVVLPSLFDLTRQPDSLPFACEGADYFLRARAIGPLDAQLRSLSQAGIVVSLILLVTESGDEARNAIFLHPRYDRAAKTNRMSAWNVETAEGARYLRAAIAFLAQRYSQPAGAHGRVWNYIVGNEVNSHWWWHNMGHASVSEVADNYERALRLVHDVTRASLENARVFLSLEHHWGIRYPPGAPDQSCPGRELLETVARLARERGDFPWHVAHHPYPENLGDPRFWRDQSARPADDSPRITFKNLELLPRFLARPELQYHGQPRRIILSEQGFHVRFRKDDDGGIAAGEQEQAAAFCAAWWKVERLSGIDAFIYHRHVDHAHEGLSFGLWTNRPGSIADPERRRPIYEVFRAADTAGWEAAFAFALPVIGIQRWEELLPGR